MLDTILWRFKNHEEINVLELLSGIPNDISTWNEPKTNKNDLTYVLDNRQIKLYGKKTTPFILNFNHQKTIRYISKIKKKMFK